MRRVSLLVAAFGLLLTSVMAADEVKLDGIKCLVQKDKPAKEPHDQRSDTDT